MTQKIILKITAEFEITPDCPDYERETLSRVKETICCTPYAVGLYEDWDYKLVSQRVKAWLKEAK